MRAIIVSLAILVGVVGCGPSTAQIKTAKTAVYRAPARNVLDVALQVVQDDYKIGEIDIEGVKFATQPQWYTPEGGRLSSYEDTSGEYVNAGANRRNADGDRRSEGNDFQVWFVVRVRDVDLERVIIEVTPRTYQIVPGSPKPRELQMDDPNLPPWVLGRVDTLAIAIYEQARKLYKP